MVIISRPPIAIESVIDLEALSPIVRIATTDATPMTIPKRLRAVRIFDPRIALKASLMFSNIMSNLHPSVAQMNLAMTAHSQIPVMGDQDYRTAFAVEFFKELHDLVSGLGIQGSGWLVCQ